MEVIDQFISEILTLAGPRLLLVFIILTGYMLKMIKQFPNKYIPFVSVGLGGLLAPILVDWPDAEEQSHKLRYIQVAAWLQSIISGFLIGILAWFIHNNYLRKWIDDKIPAWKKLDANGNTEIITKPKE